MDAYTNITCLIQLKPLNKTKWFWFDKLYQNKTRNLKCNARHARIISASVYVYDTIKNDLSVMNDYSITSLKMIFYREIWHLGIPYNTSYHAIEKFLKATYGTILWYFLNLIQCNSDIFDLPCLFVHVKDHLLHFHLAIVIQLDGSILEDYKQNIEVASRFCNSKTKYLLKMMVLPAIRRWSINRKW